MKYSLNPKDLNNLKGRIGEILVYTYIKRDLIPALKKEGWDVILTEHLSINIRQDSLPQYARGAFQKGNEKFFIGHGLFPSKQLLKKIYTLTALLEHWPDGFLVKLKKTGETKSLKESLEEFGLQGFMRGSWRMGSSTFTGSEHDENEQLPVVDGEIEIIEVKTDKGKLTPHQKSGYLKAVKKGYLLRLYHVEIISFKTNQFDIEERCVNSDSLSLFDQF